MAQPEHARDVSDATRGSGSARTYPPSVFARTYNAKRDDEGWAMAADVTERITLQDGTVLDMLDPVSIRRYVRKQLALNVEPTASQLSRLEMLNELAAELEAKAKTKPAADLRLIDPKAAAEELQRRLAERRGK